jgi:RNA polymerase sigma-70 factor, ECF subfamily
MTGSDQDLWQKIKQGNKKAFEIVYKSHFTSLCLYAYGLIPDKEFVKEIVNDVFLKIWDKRLEIDIKYGIKSYLYRCVHNSCIDYLSLKKEIRQNQKISITDGVKELIGEDEDYIFDQLHLNTLEADVMKSIEQLAPRCREVFMLSRFDLLSYREISEKLNISVNTVKTQMSRALDSLRVQLKEYL